MRKSLLGRAILSVWTTEPRKVLFVVATRLPESQFWSKAFVGKKLKLLLTNADVEVRIFYENSAPLPAVYNQAIQSARDDQILVFMHDDIWLNDADVLERIRLGLRRFDVIGVAGNRRRTKRQPAWLFKSLDGDQFTWDKENLSGSVFHGGPRGSTQSVYGPTPAACKLLDGVFLAVRRDRLAKAKVRFDPQFDFHFYDMDFCRKATQAGLILGTWPVNIVHESGGAFGSPGWRQNLERYLSKWRN